MIIILLGPPGSGKGTVAEALCKMYPFRHVSTGDLFRSHIKNKTHLGQQIVEYMNAGQLVPDELTVKLIEHFLQKVAPQESIIFDGFPRTVNQAEKFDLLLPSFDRVVDYVLSLDVADDIIKNRLSGRRVCVNCGEVYNLAFFKPDEPKVCRDCQGELIQRKDDQPDVISSRLAVYHELTAPLVDYYAERKKLVHIDNSGTIDSIVRQVVERVNLEQK
ncbi:adenylate kinase [Mageeibacillus indolicus]|jgi:hypothetical protein|uniref:Adenylate kinase n=2 Tax=Mageeibacillus indolicus TaxID=884684 RepID=D3QZ80_MAGIU|nr:adenylate kinase [Mageeibacillus indolicus]ADC90830.1 adenylate kinase [Mageeibacillus indolicus UPII9-5]KFA57216.1 hypothetical protein HMPREF1632_04645 [Mageeibacillus indolicus 0009-5]